VLGEVVKDLDGADGGAGCPPFPSFSVGVFVALVLDALQGGDAVFGGAGLTGEFLDFAVAHAGKAGDEDVAGGSQDAGQVLGLTEPEFVYPRACGAVCVSDEDGLGVKSPKHDAGGVSSGLLDECGRLGHVLMVSPFEDVGVDAEEPL